MHIECYQGIWRRVTPKSFHSFIIQEENSFKLPFWWSVRVDKSSSVCGVFVSRSLLILRRFLFLLWISPARLEWNLDDEFLGSFQWLVAEVSLVHECHWTSLMSTQHWFGQWLGAVRQQAIAWANVDPDLCPHLASLGHSEFNSRRKCPSIIIARMP